MFVETGKKILCLSRDTGKQSGNISTPATQFAYFSSLGGGTVLHVYLGVSSAGYML